MYRLETGQESLPDSDHCGLALGAGRETTAVNILPGAADRLKPGLPLRISAVGVGVPASGGLGTGSTDRLKPGLQPQNPPVSAGISATAGIDPDQFRRPSPITIRTVAGRVTVPVRYAHLLAGE